MADKGIIFSAAMVRALLDGRKTQTRRLMPHQDALRVAYSPIVSGRSIFNYACEELISRAPYALGDRLYVREAWKVEARFDDVAGGKLPRSAPIYHLESPSEPTPECAGRYRQGRFMPRWASRLTLTVTDVRVQRMQEIIEEDAVAEGIEPYGGIDPDCSGWRNYLSDSEHTGHWLGSARESYRTLWNSLHTAEGERWEDDPWIIAVSFDVRHGNIDLAASPEKEHA